MVYIVKLNPNGSINKYNARLVVKGYTQIARIGCYDSFSLIAKDVTIIFILAIVVSRSWPIEPLDINDIFLHGHLKKDVYIKIPDRYSGSPNKVCMHKRSLYGLKQYGTMN